MAKQSNSPANDPAALAFSAVEDALKASVFDTDTAPPSSRSATQPRSERLRTADKIAAQAGSVANDDRLQGSKILYGLQTRASSTPTWVALGASAVWVLGTVIAGALRFSGDFAKPGFIGSLEFMTWLGIVIIPVIGFFAIATLVRRAQDLRLAATSITQAAVRLA